MSNAHKGQIVPMQNQMIPIDKTTTFHADFDHDLVGFNQGEPVYPLGFSRGYKFDNSCTYIGNSDSISLANRSFTVELWAKKNPERTTSEYLFSQGSVTTANRFIHIGYRSNTQFTFAFYSNDLDVTVSSSTDWVHWACTYDYATNTKTIFRNGIQIASAASVPFIGTADTHIGKYSSSNTSSSSVGDVRIWNYVRSSEQIRDFMNVQLSGKETGLVGYWKLNEKEGPIAFNSSDYGNDGVWDGGITSTYGPTVASISKEGGRFKGAVLVEPETVNLLTKNQSVFEADLSAWAINNYTNRIVVEKKPSGWNGYSYIKLSRTDASVDTAFTMSIQSIPVVKNTPYTFSWYQKLNFDASSIGDNSWAPAIRFFDSTNAQIQETRFRNLGTSNEEWHRIACTAMAPDGAVTARVQLGMDQPNLFGGSYICITGLQFEPRDCATSFTLNDRPLGRLWYPKELINPSSFTISCWFNIPYMHSASSSNTTGIQGNWYHPIIELCPRTNKGSTGLSIVAGPNHASYLRKPLILFAGGVSTGTNTSAPTSISDNTWYHAICVFDGSTYKLYIDGVLQHSVVAGVTNIADDYVLMVGGGYRGKPFIKTDELRIESRAISEEEVAAWAASGLHYNYLDYSHYVD